MDGNVAAIDMAECEERDEDFYDEEAASWPELDGGEWCQEEAVVARNDERPGAPSGGGPPGRGPYGVLGPVTR